MTPSVTTALALLLPGLLAAQQSDTTRYAVLRGADTIAVETVVREDVTTRGELAILIGPRTAPPMTPESRPIVKDRLTRWSVVVDPQGAAALVEVVETEEFAQDNVKPRMLHRTRVIFKGDSVAVDDATNKGLLSNVYGTTAGAVPYLNLSAASLEVALRRAAKIGGASVPVPLFNLAGAQTASAVVTRTGDRTATLQLGPIAFSLATDEAGRLVEAAVPAQQLRIVRR